MPSYGRFTQVDLGDIRFLGEDCSRLNREAARFALELAAVAYDFEVDRWMDAGWTDISIQADERLMGGMGISRDARRPLYQHVVNEVLPIIARRHIASEHHIRQIRGLIWKPSDNEDDPQTGKAITMIRELTGGRFAVAIGFMGTGRRQIDWLQNLQFAHPEGFHEGFLDICAQFEENSERVLFEQTARRLGLPVLSLRDVLREARGENSRFHIIAAGHSQGAAVLQLWVHRRMSEGLLPGHLLAYGFAPPSVAARSVTVPDGYPLHLISNSDDIITRVGLYRHIGQNHLFEADDAFRALCYQGYDSNPLMGRLLTYSKSFAGTQDSMRFLIAYIAALNALPPGQSAAALSLFAGGGLRERILRRQTEPMAGLLRMLGRVMRRNYETALLTPVNEELVRMLSLSLQADMQKEGAERFTRSLILALRAPHYLVFRDENIPGLAPYACLVIREFGRLRDAE